jgi:hypothetical protein
MILGLRTAIYPTPDLAKGKAWYSQVLPRLTRRCGVAKVVRKDDGPVPMGDDA